MRNDLCKKCGAETIEFHRCAICKKACKFICPKCTNITEDQVHVDCIENIRKYRVAAT